MVSVLNQTETTGPIKFKFRTKLTNVVRSNTSLLPFQFYLPCKDGGRLHDVITKITSKLHVLNNYIFVNMGIA